MIAVEYTPHLILIIKAPTLGVRSFFRFCPLFRDLNMNLSTEFVATPLTEHTIATRVEAAVVPHLQYVGAIVYRDKDSSRTWR